MRKLDQPSSEICEIVDQRDGRSCARCGKSLYTVYGARHHRKLRSQASKAEKHTASNLIDVCETCHRWIHAHPAESYERGYLIHSYESPEDVPIYHKRYGWVMLDNNGGVSPVLRNEH